MNAKTLIKKLESNDVKIWIEDDKVKWHAPKGVITDKVLVQMKDQKPELLVILRDKLRTSKQGIKGKNLKKPEKCEIQGDTNKILNDLVGQVQRIIQEALDMNNKKVKDIISVVFPLKSVIQKCDVVIEWATERGDPVPFGSPTTPQVNKSDDYDGDQNDKPKIGAATCRSPRLLTERCSAISPYLNKIILGDCLEKLKDIPEDSVDLIATDPPYGLKFMGKDWDKAVPSIEIWKECLRTLKPGGLAYIMCGPRQDCLSRMIKNLEDAGFRTNFTSLYWTYASGFPKAYNIAKGIEGKLKLGSANWSDWKKLPGEKGVNNLGYSKLQAHQGYRDENYQGRERNITVDYTTTEAKRFEGSYGGFQPKPAVEVIIVAMKPMTEKTYVGQALKNGKGVTWMDDCRIPYSAEKEKWSQHGGVVWSPQRKWGQSCQRSCHEEGRCPANLLISDDVLDDGKKPNQGHWAKTKTIGYGEFGSGNSEYYGTGNKINEAGTYSRFFSLDAWAEKNLPFFIVPKASKKEKDTGCENLPVREKDTRSDRAKGSMKEKGQPSRNIHPTVKPIKLMSYLITMGSRKDDVVLDPFCGSGSTCVAAKMLKRKFIGIELDERYREIAVKRIKAAKPLMAQSQKRNNQIITQIGNKEEKRCHQG
jgi:DNA modification methylase